MRPRSSLASIKDVATGRTYAGKVISKRRLARPRAQAKLLAEIRINRSLKHRHVVRFERCFEDGDNVYILQELCEGQTLAELLRARGTLSEGEVAEYVRQLAEALGYVHSRSCCHRDVKLGNVFIASPTFSATRCGDLRLGDFGLACKLETPEERKQTVCGTPNYIAPEVIAGEDGRGHSFEVDTWALGCLAYALLVGRPPFETKDVQSTYKRIRGGEYAFPQAAAARLSAEAKDLVRWTLQADPSKRPTMQQVLEHPFVACGGAFGRMSRAVSPPVAPAAPAPAEAPPPARAQAHSSTSASENGPQPLTPDAPANVARRPALSPLDGNTTTHSSEAEGGAGGGGAPVDASDGGMAAAEVSAESSSSGGSDLSTFAEAEAVGTEMEAGGSDDSRCSEGGHAAAQAAVVSPGCTSPQAPGTDEPAQRPPPRHRYDSSDASDSASGDVSPTSDEDELPGEPSAAAELVGEDIKESVARRGRAVSPEGIGTLSPSEASSERATTPVCAPAYVAETSHASHALGERSAEDVEDDDELAAVRRTLSSSMASGTSPEQAAVGTRGSASPPLSCSPALTSMARVMRWVDYSHKYGLGYVLSDGSSGVLFNDASKIVRAAGAAGAYTYLEPRAEPLVGRLTDPAPADKGLTKKLKLLAHFYDYLSARAPPPSCEAAGAEAAGGLPAHVRKWVRTQHCILLRLSNRLIQVEFNDGSQLVLGGDGARVCYVETSGTATEYALGSLPANASLKKRLKYVRQVLASMSSSSK